MKSQITLGIVTALLIVAGIAYGILSLMAETFSFRWLFVIVLGIMGAFGLQFVKDKELILIRSMVVILPFQTGFLYSDIIKVDLIFAFDVILLLLYLMWVVDSGSFRFKRLFFPKEFLPASLHVMWAMLSISMAISLRASIFGVLLLVKAFFMFVYLINRIRSHRQLLAIAHMLIIAMIFQSVLGILQQVTNRPLGLGFLGEPLHRTYYRRIQRVTGTFGLPNLYGAFIIFTLPLPIALFIYDKNRWKRLFYFCSIAVGFFGVLLSLSRSAWMGMFLAIVVMLTLMSTHRGMGRKRTKGILIILVGFILLFLFSMDVIMWRMQIGVRGQWRKIMIGIALQLIQSNPLLGVGLYNYEYHSYGIFAFWRPVHNEFLRLASETGLPGVSFFLWFIVMIIRDAYRALKFNDKYVKAMGLAIIGAFTAFLVLIQFGPEYQHYSLKCTFWVMASLAIVLRKVYRTERARREQHMRLMEQRKESD